MGMGFRQQHVLENSKYVCLFCHEIKSKLEKYMKHIPQLNGFFCMQNSYTILNEISMLKAAS